MPAKCPLPFKYVLACAVLQVHTRVELIMQTSSFQTYLELARLAEWIVYTDCQMDVDYVMTEQFDGTAGGTQQLC